MDGEIMGVTGLCREKTPVRETKSKGKYRRYEREKEEIRREKPTAAEYQRKAIRAARRAKI